MFTYKIENTKINIHAIEYDPQVIYSIPKDVLNIFKEIHLMPDTHIGSTVPIGFVAEFNDKILPSIIGSDIGCGMLSYDIPKQEIDFYSLESYINQNIPSGAKIHNKEQKNLGYLKDLTFKLKNISNIKKSFATLGGGNHFIEIVNKKNNYTIVIHTGSRSLGNEVYNHYNNLLKQNKNNQSYLVDESLKNYFNDITIAQRYAQENRLMILKKILQFFNITFDSSYMIDVPHNYIDFENNIIHKGSISANEKEKVIIPLNMRDGVIFGTGKGNKEWLNSAPHGSGRKLSRSLAKELITIEDFKNSMNGINTFSVSDNTIAESPFAYKNSNDIIECSKATIDTIEIAKPIFNFKSK